MTRDGHGGLPPRSPVIGVPISCTSYGQVLDLIERRSTDRSLTFAFCNVHTVVSARRDPSLAAAIASFDVTTPDGMPLVWMLRRLGHPRQGRVYGPDLMELALAHGVDQGWSHYLYGTTADTLVQLEAAAARIAPGVRIVGRTAPPYRPATDDEVARLVADVRDSGADCLWIALGMPRQEHFVDRIRDQLPGVALLPVGAAFDLLAGTVPQAPDWIQDRGLEWAYRLWREPRRLWRRYLFTNPVFVVAALGQLIRHRWQQRRRRHG